MTSNFPSITGIGSVSPYGPLAGGIAPRLLQPRLITAWPITGVRRAYLVEPFRTTDVVPGLKTRRLDRLSVWSLVAASLAIKDAGIELDQVDRSRVAVVFATGLGCIELTEAYLRSANGYGWSQTDPITFPETLGNSPASHVARCLDLRGPNVTVGSQGLAGECALLQAVSLLRNGQADLALVLAGDTLTRTAYEWYEVAGLLSRDCFHTEPVTDTGGFVPSEGVTAMLLEPADKLYSRHGFHSYASFRAGHLASGAEPAAVVRRVLGAFPPGAAICCAGGSHGDDRPALAAAREVLGERATMCPRGAVPGGLGDTGALLRLSLALGEAPAAMPLLWLGAAANGGFAALLLELP